MPAEHSRKSFLITVGSLVTLLAVIIFSQVSLNIPFIRPTDSETTILLFVLSTIVSLAFIVFGFILFRNILKLWVERRARILGSQFKFKLVAGALALSLLPVVFLFYSSYALMNRTMDKWFSQPFERVTKDTREIVSQLSNYASHKTEQDARSVAAGLPAPVYAPDGQPQITTDVLAQLGQAHGVDYLLWIDNEGQPRAASPEGPKLFNELSADERAHIHALRRVLFADGAEFSVAIAPLSPGSGWLMAGNRLPAGLFDKLVEMRREQDNYEQLRLDHKKLRKTLIAILALVTIIILFITTWVALFLSKQVTIPIQHLAAATQAVSQGRFEHRVQTSAMDELGVLVASFNEMTAQLETQRRQLEASRGELENANRELESANAELDQRTRFTEAILESIPTGVISLSAKREVLRLNPGVERLLGGERVRNARELRDLFAVDELKELERLLRRSVRLGTVTSQFELTVQGHVHNVAITAASLLQEVGEKVSGGRDVRGPNRGPLAAMVAARGDAGDGTSALQSPALQRPRYQNLGYILVLEDLSDVIYAQQVAAWREVAKRIAHEIKNPLTPIALSAERIRRHLERAQASGAETLQDSLPVIGECTSLIEQEVGTLKNLVDEFTQLARFPKAKPVPCDLNGVVQNAVALFNGRFDDVQLELDLSADLPLVLGDADQLKRVIVNLVDNAAEAMQESVVRELRISTAELRGEAVELTVADSGPGVSPELKEKLFLPYFSTKKRGTGLGLAIVNRIVNEHNGSIRVEENRPNGARFIIELPLAAAEAEAAGASGG